MVKRSARGGHTVVLEEERPKKKKGKQKAAAKPARVDPVDRLLEKVQVAAPAPLAAPRPSVPPSGLRVARLVRVDAQHLEIAFRGSKPESAQLAEGVERALLIQALKNRDSVMVETSPDQRPLVVGVLQTRIPSEVTLKGATVTIEAERELLLRAGRAGLRLREDGDVELVGSRIMAMSRGLFRIVGRVLRLN